MVPWHPDDAGAAVWVINVFKGYWMEAFNWKIFLDRHRDGTILEWKKRLKEAVSPHYAQRPSDELAGTTTRAFDAFTRVLAFDDYTLINKFINKITKARLETGFPLDDVQKAFEIYRQLIIPILIKESPVALLCKNIEAVNTSLAYTIHRFSNHFQKMHEKYIKDYAKQLEKDVAARTSELKESEFKYKTLVEDISDGYLALNREIITFVNPAFCRMHGYEDKEIIQESFLQLVAKESHKKVKQAITGQKRFEIEPEAFEYLRQTRNGECLPTEINFRALRFKDQELTLCIVRDITKRVETEKKNRQIERMTYIGELTASLSHEIRNPLSSVKMNLQILSRNIILSGNDRKRLQISENEIDRLESILQGLLNYAKPLILKPSLININEIICSCFELLKIKFFRKSINYQLKADNNLRAFPADKGKLEQIIINLLLNALDSVDDFGEIRVLTSEKQQDGSPYAVIRIEDDGKGIGTELIPHIFEPFYTTKTNGTGLGLANVKQIVNAHNGEIHVFNLENKGTAFEISLPMGQHDD